MTAPAFDGLTCIDGVVGTIVRKFFVNDICGNTDSSCVQMISVIDTLAPQVVPGTCAWIRRSPVMLLASDPASLGMPHYTDNCSDSVLVANTISFRDDSTGFDGLTCIDGVVGTIVRKFFVNDICGNTDSSCVQMILVIDTVAPQVVPGTCALDTTITCDALASDPASLGMPHYTDNCSDSVLVANTISFRDDSTGFDGLTCIDGVVGTIARKFFVNDICGNTDSSCVQMISVIDTVAPVISCPLPDTLRFECGQLFSQSYINLDSFLNRGGLVIENCCLDSSSFKLLDEIMSMPNGMATITRRYSISDCCGNLDTCTQVLQMPPCFLDLALKLEIDGPEPYFASPGDEIPFKITVYNQFMVPADSIKIIVYLPTAGSYITSPGWVNNGDGTATINLTRGNELPQTGLLLGDSVVVNYNVYLGLDVHQAIEVSEAEIFSAQDTFHNVLNDLDSYPNSLLGDDAGGAPMTGSDNAINGNGTGVPGNTDPQTDEDDQDPAQFYVCGNITCINKVNVSLNDQCQKCFEPADFLKGSLLPGQYYQIELHDASGKLIPSNCLDRAWIGYSITYKVTTYSPCAFNSCWGTLIVEDKLPPDVGAAVDTVTCFDIGAFPKGPYKVKDNCSDSVLVNIAGETFTDYGCDSANIQGVVTRTLIARDAWGNSTNLTKTHYILKLSLDSLVCPADFEIACGAAVPVPTTSTSPSVKTIKGLKSLWPSSAACKLLVTYTDKQIDLCGKSYKIFREWLIVDWCTGQEKICKQIISVLDKTAPVPSDSTLAVVHASPHDCGQYVDLPLLKYTDCNRVTQIYNLKYDEEGTTRVLRGSLPASHIWLPVGSYSIDVRLIDACYNESEGKIDIAVVDITPPAPICVEVTQVTLDPVGCWGTIAAKDLDNGSRDNCCNVLHFAVAPMDSITYWRNYWNTSLETEVGKTEFWNKKADYDGLIEDWINYFVFSDTVHFDECGTNQVVLRVYEACGVPKYDPHVFPCSPHAWFCYNTYLYIADFNYNWFDPKGAKSCNYRPDLTSLASEHTKSLLC
ncbi:MAG: hypothetical protein IPP42_24845 [Saprospiraceae bacterium]|nr:hypothetical protein [Saprospiraceae bacterium]